MLGWVEANLERFDPPQEDELLDQAPEALASSRARKAFAELGIAIRLGLAHPPPGTRDRIASLAGWWVATARRRNLFFDAVRRTRLLPLSIVNYLTLRELGEDVGDVGTQLERAVALAQLDRTDASLWPRQNLCGYMDAAGLEHPFEPLGEMTGQSMLRRLPALHHATDPELYCFTHLLFAITAFGARRMEPVAGVERHELLSYARLALITCVVDRKWDLVGELLMNRLHLDSADELDACAGRALAGAQSASGAIPAHGRCDLAAAGGTAEFDLAYHTTLVTLMALAAWEQRAQGG